MRVSLSGAELYADVAGSQLRAGDGRLAEYPTMVVLPGGPGFDQGYLRPAWTPWPPRHSWSSSIFAGRGGPADRRWPPAPWNRWPMTSPNCAQRWASPRRWCSAIQPGASSRCT